jgi:hypothetical protein
VARVLEGAMGLTSMLQVFITGVVGGIVLELVHWYNIIKAGDWPAYGNRVGYWIVTGLMAMVGGGLAVLYFGSRADGLVAFHVGLSAPLILQKLTTTIATTPGAKGGGKGILTFFDW